MTHWTKRIVYGALLLGVLVFPGAAGAENLVYKGDTNMLQPDPEADIFKSLYPSTASGNTVIVDYDAADASKVPVGVYGGAAATGDSVNNTVIIRNGSIINWLAGGRTVNGNARNNTVNVYATSNTIARVYGGMARIKGDAVGNTVNIYGGTVGSVAGGWTMNGSASGNTVTVYGGTTGALYGGEIHAGDAFNNTVAVYGGLVDNIYGGSATGGAAYNNTVTLSGRPQFLSSGGEIWGGYVSVNSPDFTGNTLNLWNYSGTTSVKLVTGFQYYNFQVGANSQPLMVDTGAGLVEFGDGAGGDSTVTGVSFASGYTPQKGDVITLLSAATGFSDGLTNPTQMESSKGVTLLYSGDLVLGTNDLTYTITSDDYFNPRSNALSEGRVATVAFLNQGADLTAGQGMIAARNAGNGLQAFAAGSVGESRYETGSHVDVQGMSFMAGLAWNAPTAFGNLTLGAFFEAGDGTYDTHNSFSNAAAVNGDGDTNYYGGGILGRVDSNAGPGVFYVEASGRMGRSDTEFSSSDLMDGTGRKAAYDSDSLYFGAHAGLGYIWNITEAASLDLYTKYFWTRQTDDTVTLSTDDRVKFKDADSRRWRGGARFGYDFTTSQGSTITPYIGAAYEHEFDGKAKATTSGYNLATPDLKGGTGIGEAGFTFKAANTGFSVDVGVQGYTGVRDGVTGSMQFKWGF
ncbi:autotransporter domain-containing protein [Desulfovibrio sp. OttesenSCG-928-I05]|nr:autotransporter domain-containing protein [Desulfovibrio sp. OttesenSCG-928-I05]